MRSSVLEKLTQRISMGHPSEEVEEAVRDIGLRER